MSDPKKPSLFSNEFPPVSTPEWEEKIREDLCGADYQKRLVWKTPEGFEVQPYYRNEHLTDIEYLNTPPGTFPYTRGTKPNSNTWEIRQDFHLNDIEPANKESLFVIDHGVTSLGFICLSEPEIKKVSTQADLSRLLKNIPLDRIGLNLICGRYAPQIIKLLWHETEIRKFSKDAIHGSVDFDPLGYLTITGQFSTNEDADFTALNNIFKDYAIKLPNYKLLAVNGYFFQNAGASITQELGYSLALAAEYLSRLTDSGLAVDLICNHLQFNLGIGSNYFMEIAKLRALRFLWANITEAYHPESEESKKAYIHSISSEWNQTLYDPYMNVLRATTESMAAIIGGTDSLTVRPFTYPYKSTTKLSARIARNIQIILNEEAYFGKTVDPAGGSYYIENLTDAIIEEAWRIFLKIESDGGYLRSLKKGSIQKDIENTTGQRNNSIATRREILVGTNQYPNFDESVKNDITKEIAFPKTNSATDIISPLKIYRGSMEFEKLRLATEKHAHLPVVFILPCGNVTMRRARAVFSCNFFACAGYRIIDNPGFSTPEEGTKAALRNKADVIVVCSSDDEYAVIVPEVLKQIKNKAILVVAGAPESMNELKKQGVDNFIHIRSNVLETLRYYHKMLGISL